MSLPELSAAATQAFNAAMEGAGQNLPRGEFDKLLERNTVANERFAAALVNAYRTGQLVERDGVDLVGANTLPTEYARWLSSIEVDVRVHDLTADEVARLIAAVAPERDAVEGAVEALEARVAKLREALEPLACLGIPTKPQGNAGFYSIYHKHIIAARAAIGGEA